MILFVDIFVPAYSYKPNSAFLWSLIIGVYLFFKRKYKNADIVNVLIGQGRTSYDPYI